MRSVRHSARAAAAMSLAALMASPALADVPKAPTNDVTSAAQPGDEAHSTDDDASLAKKLSNPVANLISVPFQENIDFGGGVTGSGTKSTLNIQPVIPISISQSANIIVRTIVPVIFQSDIRGNDQNDFGLGDTTQSFFYSPKKPTAGGLIWGLGPVFYYPTGTSKYTTAKKWGAGPTIVVLKQFGPTTVGFLGNHIWSVAGSDNRPPISSSFFQPFISYTTKAATTYTLNTESTYDWKTNQWSVPINFAVSQMLRVGKQPVSLGVGGRYYVASPQYGAHWGLRFITTLLYPKK